METLRARLEMKHGHPTVRRKHTQTIAKWLRELRELEAETLADAAVSIAAIKRRVEVLQREAAKAKQPVRG
jgi:hypothetical protein